MNSWWIVRNLTDIWDSIAFIALLFDGLLVNADERKNLAIGKTERAKKRKKEMAYKQPFENYNVHLQKNAPSVLAKCQNARPDPKSPIPRGFQATFLDLLSMLSWKLNTPLYP